ALADQVQAVVERLGGLPVAPGELADALLVAVGFLQELALAAVELLQAVLEGGQAFVAPAQRRGALGRQGVEQAVVEAEAVARGDADEVADLVEGDPAGPGEEVAARLPLVELLPEDQAGALEDVLRVGPVRKERVEIGEEAVVVEGELPEEGLRGLRRRRLVHALERTAESRFTEEFGRDPSFDIK